MGKCLKKRFRDELSAKIALANIHARHNDSRKPKEERRYYRCPNCRGYHLTSQE